MYGRPPKIQIHSGEIESASVKDMYVESEHMKCTVVYKEDTCTACWENDWDYQEDEEEDEEEDDSGK